jgi:hypothetical protein
MYIFLQWCLCLHAHLKYGRLWVRAPDRTNQKTVGICCFSDYFHWNMPYHRIICEILDITLSIWDFRLLSLVYALWQIIHWNCLVWDFFRCSSWFLMWWWRECTFFYSGVFVCMLTSSTVDCEFEPRTGQTKRLLVFVASPLSTQRGTGCRGLEVKTQKCTHKYYPNMYLILYCMTCFIVLYLIYVIY